MAFSSLNLVGIISIRNRHLDFILTQEFYISFIYLTMMYSGLMFTILIVIYVLYLFQKVYNQKHKKDPARLILQSTFKFEYFRYGESNP